MEAAHHPWPALGALLLRDGLVDKDELEAVLTLQEDSGHHRISARRLGELLVDRGTVTHTQVAQLVAEQYELPFMEVAASDVSLHAATLLPEELARRFCALPVSMLPDRSLLVAVSDPPLVLFSDEFHRLLGVPLRYAVTPADELEAAIAYAGARASAVETESTAPAQLVAVEDVDGEPEGLVRSSFEVEPVLLPVPPTEHRSAALGALLVRDGLLGEDELEAALAQQRIGGNKRLGEILVERGAVTRTQVARLVAEQYDLRFVELDVDRVDVQASRLLPEEMARRLTALPVGFADDGSLLVLVSDPTNVVYADELRLAVEGPIQFAVAAPDALEDAIDVAYGDAPAVEEDDALLGEPEIDASPTAGAYGDAPAVEEDDALLGEPEVDASPTAGPEDTLPEDAEEAEDAVLAEVDPDAEGDGEAEAEAPGEPEQWLDDDLLAEIAEIVDPRDDDVAFEEASTEVEEAVSVAVIADDVEATGSEAVEDEVDPVARDVDEAIRLALSLAATSVQFTPQPGELAVRCRIDGSTRELGAFPGEQRDVVTSRLASLAGLGAIERAPRDGLLPFLDGDQTLHLPTTSIPTKLGVQMTLRLPAGDESVSSLGELGLGPEAEAAVREALRRADGAIVVCGTPLSGRTTTLYALLHELSTPDRTLVTIEDPVTRLAPGIVQVEVDPTSGLTYGRGLRALLRSDPDVVLVGDLRESEAAQVAHRAARTTQILTSVEARTASSALASLAQLGVEPRVLSSTLSCVLAQHLVRRICTDCRETYYASADEIAALGRPEEEAGRRLLARGRGCASCGGSGHRGWAAVFEALPLTDGIRALVAEQAPASVIREAASAAGMTTTREAAVALCLDGITSASEVLLVATD